ncbi:MAG: methylcobamide--CoM methyltransferase [Clostridia bacterium]|nr:methylcobamide--CoM methyltransferase [Clostridia bacterium]
MSVIPKPLPREEVIKAIEFKTPSRIPMVFTKWWGEGLYEQYGDRLSQFAEYPEDVCCIGFPCPSFERRDDGFCWHLPEVDASKFTGNDATVRLPDWDYIDELVANPPNVNAPGLWDKQIKQAEKARAEGRYILIHHWSLMFERIWNFRGMENLLADYYEEPENVHKLHNLICDTELKLLEQAIELIKPDGYSFSDDLGSQNSLMMSPAMFREFIKPYYVKIWGNTHKYGIHNWLHTCGCVEEIIGDLIEAGLDVLHPIQKHTMDWDEIAAKWKGKITFWAGMDVQQTLRFGTPEDVRKEVRLMKRTFSSPEGGMILASGNGIVGGTPFENIAAFLDECCQTEF